jgi:hypothetical protein
MYEERKEGKSYSFKWGQTLATQCGKRKKRAQGGFEY